MSIIKCPDCEKDISSTSKQCIHCGCIFTVCPECETIFSGKISECKECGYKFKNDNSTKPSEEKEYTILNAYSKSENENSIFKIATNGGVAIGLCILSIVLALTAFIGTLTWGNYSSSEALDTLAKYQSTLSSRKTLYIFAALAFSASSLLIQFQLYLRNSNFQSFANRYGLNLLTLCDNEFKVGFDKVVLATLGDRFVAISAAISAMLYDENIYQKDKELKDAIFAAGGTAVSAFALCIFAIKNTDLYMKAKFMSSSAEFGFSDFKLVWLLIAAIVIYVIKTIISNRNDKKAELERTNWVKNHLPQHLDNYTKYIKGYIDYVFDASEKKHK